MADMRTLIHIAEGRIREDVMAPVRDAKLSEPPPPPPKPPRRRGGDDGPKGGRYWVRNASKVAITGKANEIVNLAGQVMLLNPERFGLTSDEVMEYLRQHGAGPHGAAAEYEKYLAGTDYDLSHVALLWRASQAAFRMLIERGWMQVTYAPEHDAIMFAASPAVVKRQIQAAAMQFPMMQIGTIIVTEITDFDVGSGRYLYMTKNRTMRFSREDFAGFAGTFGATAKWAETGEAPTHNYLYMLLPYPPASMRRAGHAGGLSARKASIVIMDRLKGKVRRERYCIAFLTEPPASVPDGQHLYRVPRSLAMQVGMGLSVDHKGRVALWGDRYFSLHPRDIEALVDGKWGPV